MFTYIIIMVIYFVEMKIEKFKVPCVNIAVI